MTELQTDGFAAARYDPELDGPLPEDLEPVASDEDREGLDVDYYFGDDDFFDDDTYG